MNITGPAGAGATGTTRTVPGLDPERDTKLRKASTQLEGSFVQQMFKAMRDTVPTDGAFGGGAGEDMFTGLLDEHVAADTPTQWHHGLGEAIYRQLRTAIQSHVVPPSGTQR